MSNITKEDINKLSRLARIEVDEDSSKKLKDQLNKIITWVEKMEEVNTDNVEPLNNVNDLVLRMAEDKIADGGIAEDILKNSKHSKYNYFTVPKVIE